MTTLKKLDSLIPADPQPPATPQPAAKPTVSEWLGGETPTSEIHGRHFYPVGPDEETP